MDKGSGFALVSIFVIVFLACAAQSATPVSPPESRFVWEPGENLTFTWTNENFGWFYYDAQGRTGNESLTIKLDKIKERSIPKGGIVYSTMVGTATARYRRFGEYAVVGFMGEKYLAGFPEGKSNITNNSLINLRSLHKILNDENANYTLVNGSTLTLNEGYFIEVRDVNAAGAQVSLSLRKEKYHLNHESIEVDTKTIDAGKNYVYMAQDGTVIAVHIDSVFKGNETASVTIKGIFQVSDYQTSVNEDDRFGVVVVTKVSDTGITMKNTFVPVDLKPGSVIEIIDGIILKVADSNVLRVLLYSDWYYEKIEPRGATGSNNLTAWDGLNYAGFLYDADSGNYSESLVITNMTGRRIPEGGLTYTSYRLRVPYEVTKINGKNLSGTDGSYVTSGLGGNKYAVKSNGPAKILIAHGDSISEKKALKIGPYGLNGETWELGEGYALTVKSLDLISNPRKARLVLTRNGVKLDDVWLSSENAYRYFQPGETGTPKLITYLDAVYAGATDSIIMLRYTWFVSDDITQIKEGDSLGVFNVTDVESDRMVLKNREPIELKAGRIINLYGNLSFFVENSDELRFYPTNMAGTQVMSEEVTVNETLNITDTTSPAAGKNERVPGFESVLAITILLAVYATGRKRR